MTVRLPVSVGDGAGWAASEAGATGSGATVVGVVAGGAGAVVGGVVAVGVVGGAVVCDHEAPGVSLGPEAPGAGVDEPGVAEAGSEVEVEVEVEPGSVVVVEEVEPGSVVVVEEVEPGSVVVVELGVVVEVEVEVLPGAVELDDEEEEEEVEPVEVVLELGAVVAVAGLVVGELVVLTAVSLGDSDEVVVEGPAGAGGTVVAVVPGASASAGPTSNANIAPLVATTDSGIRRAAVRRCLRKL